MRTLHSPLPDNLRAAQDAVGKTSEICAREAGVTLRTWTKWRCGESEPSWEYLVRIGQVLGREPAWFYASHEEEPVA